MSVLSLADWMALITGVLQFPGQLLQLVKILQTTPQENHQKLLQKIAEEATQFQQTGRPTW